MTSFIPLGIGDAFSALHYGACLAIEHEGRWLLVDCPHPIRKMMREGGIAAGLPELDVGNFEGLVLTHLHADHASGLEGCTTSRFGGRRSCSRTRRARATCG